MKGAEYKEFDKQRKYLMKEFDKLGKRFSEIVYTSALNKKLTLIRQLKLRQREISKLESELQSLKKGKVV